MTTDLTTTTKRSLVADLAAQAGLSPQNYYEAVKRQCGCAGAEDSDFAALLLTARAHDLSPIMREMWLFPGQNRSVRPVISHDGWFKILTRHPRYVHHVFREGEDDDGRYGEVDIFTRESCANDLPPYQHREYLREVTKGPTWKTYPKRMLRGRTISQGARHCFGIAGVDPDEAAMPHGEDDEPRVVPVDVRPAVPMDGLGEAGDDARGEGSGGQAGLSTSDPSAPGSPPASVDTGVEDPAPAAPEVIPPQEDLPW